MKTETLDAVKFKHEPGFGSGRTELFKKIHNNRYIKNKKKEEKNLDNGAIYFLTFIIIIIVTFSLFKTKILHLIFSHFL